MTWGIDLADVGTALVITILLNRDLQRLRTGDETVTDLKILTGRRTDLVADRTRTVNRLRAQLTDIFSGLERALDLTNTGPLTLLTSYKTPASLRRTGKKRLETWLRNRRVLRPDRLAETAWEAAARQHTSLPGEQLTAQMLRTLAAEVTALNQQVAELDKAAVGDLLPLQGQPLGCARAGTSRVRGRGERLAAPLRSACLCRLSNRRGIRRQPDTPMLALPRVLMIGRISKEPDGGRSSTEVRAPSTELGKAAPGAGVDA